MVDRRSGWLGLALLCTAAMPAGAATVSISCGGVGAELKICQEGAEIWAQRTGNQVNVVPTPSSATERLALYQQILAAGSGDIDVYQIDVIWPGILATHFIDLSDSFSEEEVGRHFPKIVENNTVDGELKAIPWFTEAGMLYYRTDLLEKYGKQPPATWQELEATAREIAEKEREAGQARMEGFVFQAKAYEGLTCDALEWVDSFGGGSIVDAEGNITINNPKAAEALTWAASAVGTIAPQGVLNYQEEESRGVFQSGNAVFMRNWPYAWALAQAPDSAISGKVAVAPLPKGGEGGKPTGTLGGWQLAVAEYSSNQEEAIELVRYLTSPEEQKRRALVGAYNPTIEALYKDEEITKAVPFLDAIYPTLINAVARPSRVTESKYNQVSAEFFNTVHSILSKQAEAPAALASLEKSLDRISRGGRW